MHACVCVRAPLKVVVSSCSAADPIRGVPIGMAVSLPAWLAGPHLTSPACCPCRPCGASCLTHTPTHTCTRACCDAAGFLSLDTDGRVVRVDTLAKLLGPGFRLGWLSGPPPLVAKLGLYMAGISIGANMVSQVSRRWAQANSVSGLGLLTTLLEALARLTAHASAAVEGRGVCLHLCQLAACLGRAAQEWCRWAEAADSLCCWCSCVQASAG